MAHATALRGLRPQSMEQNRRRAGPRNKVPHFLQVMSIIAFWPSTQWRERSPVADDAAQLREQKWPRPVRLRETVVTMAFPQCSHAT